MKTDNQCCHVQVEHDTCCKRRSILKEIYNLKKPFLNENIINLTTDGKWIISKLLNSSLSICFVQC